MYLSLPHLAKLYDIHVDTMRKKIKKLDLSKDEHFILIDTIVRFDIEKIHPLLTNQSDNTTANKILKQLLI
jgi:hypothetical protein